MNLHSIRGEPCNSNLDEIDLREIFAVLVRSRCRSPVTVQEWVAALPDMQREGEEGEKEDMKGGMDNLSLGAEGKIYKLFEN